jgi:alpha-D-ribose 1-methylphosphonate 5-triphosphate diphosphatase
MTPILLIENARVVLPDDVVRGWVAVADGLIAEIGEGRAPERGVDFKGDLLAPGLIELHTDNLESHLKPRPKVRWPAMAAVVAYDAQMVASGITTVFDSLRVGNDADHVFAAAELRDTIDAIGTAQRQGVLRADHKLHLRCEICADDVVAETEELAIRCKVDLISLMDHTPGARQFRNLDAWKTYYGGKSEVPPDKLDRFMERKRAQFVSNYAHHRSALVMLAKTRGIASR